MKKSLLLHVFFQILFLYPATLSAQNSELLIRGKVKTKEGAPVKNADLNILGVHNAVTNAEGFYTLNLSACTSCQPGTKLKIYVNADHGAGEFDFTVPSKAEQNKPFDIVLESNKILYISGRVKDRQSGSFIKGIKVSATLPDEQPSSVTNESGYFNIVINRYGIGNTQAITLAFQDIENKKYKDLEKIFYIVQYAPLSVELEPCSDCGSEYEFNVSKYEQTTLRIAKGSKVTIEASGVIEVGFFVGTSEPYGIEGNKGVGGFSLAIYNHFPKWNHACLLYRVGETDEWKYYDKNRKNTFTAQSSGYLEFNINDKDIENNSGEYEVTVRVR